MKDIRQAPRLTCRQCQSRKRKCDKLDPCSSCRDAGIRCETVQRTRLPRGRSGVRKAKNSELEDRVSKLEGLLRNVQPQAVRAAGGGGLEMPADSVQDPPFCPVTADSVSRRVGGFVAPEFWTALTHEVDGLRQILEGSDDEDAADETPDPGKNDRPRQTETARTLLVGHRAQRGGVSDLPWPSPERREMLLELYRERVDSVYKFLHWPTVSSIFERTTAARRGGPTPKSVHALEFAVYFMASCTVSSEETMASSFEDRLESIQVYRSATEECLADADLFGKPDFTVLGAFLIYLTALRASQNSATAWTLLAVAVRLARALRLGSEDPAAFSPLGLEIRRRLWYKIHMLDMFAAMDRGTPPLLPSSSCPVPPLMINDRDVSSAGLSGVKYTGMMEMSFFSFVTNALLRMKTILEIPSIAEDGWQGWTVKSRLLAELEQEMARTLATTLTGPETPKQKLLRLTADECVSTGRLFLRRHPYRTQRNDVPPWDDFNVLEAAVVTLEKQAHKISGDLVPWAWKAYSPWYALAIILAELCNNTRWTPLSDRAYSVAREAFDRDSNRIADGAGGMMWKPITRLMRRVERTRSHFHDNIKASSDTTPSSSDPGGGSDAKRPIIGSCSLSHFMLHDNGMDSLNLNAEPAAALPTQNPGGDQYAFSINDEDWFNWEQFLHEVDQTSGQHFF